MRSSRHDIRRPLRKGRARLTALGAVLAVAAASLSGCALSSDTGSGGETLTVATWKGYGADLLWVAQQFKKQTGATVRFEYIDSEQNELQLLQKASGGIDVALPNLQYLQQGVTDGLFAPLDTKKLTNYPDVFPSLSGRPELRKDGKLYAVPWVWGASGLFYDSSVVKTPPTSWSALWDPAYKGRVGLFDDPTILVPIAGLHLGESADNPDVAKVQPALNALASAAKLSTTSTQAIAQAASNHSAVLGVIDAGSVGTIQQTSPGIRFALPKEGGMGWVDNWAIAAKSTHQDLAYKWLNFMTSPAMLAKWANDPNAASPVPANQKAVAQLTGATVKRLQITPSTTLVDTLHLQVPEPADRLQGWINAWQQAKAG